MCRQRMTDSRQVISSTRSFVAVASLTMAILVVTDTSLSIVWDEGYTLGREARLRAWFRALADPAAFARTWVPPYEDLVPPGHALPPGRTQVDSRTKLFRPEVLEWFWPFAREEPDGHPPFYALVGLIGDVVVPSWQPLPRARFGPMLVYSLTAGAVHGFVRRRWGPWAAFAAVAAWICQPHLFALAHYATYDGLVTSLWAGCTLTFAKAVETGPDSRTLRRRWGWIALFGILVACAMGTKLTGWFLPLPLIAWVIFYRDARGWLCLIIGLALAVIFLFTLIPTWWHDPVLGLDRFFRSNLSRAETMRIKTLFLGTIYETPNGSLPWYNTLVWTLMVTPVGFLGLAVVGIVRSAAHARDDTIAIIFLIQWAFLMVLRALPHTPGHDGVRQFLPAFGMLALLIAPGAESVVRRLGRAGRAWILVAVAEGALSVGLMMPVPLSYYSPIVGGLPGATRLGMEPTFYWDAFRPDTIEWLNAHTGLGQKVLFSRYPTSWLYLRQIQALRVGILIGEPGEWTWYVVQNRPGALLPMERDLIANGHPAIVYRKCGVPLLWVFPYDEAEAWQRRKPPRSD
jgi:4-amino-4-deoxy-L-arabinose transferase-like glycosyltransferase